MMPPLITVGSKPPASTSAATSEVVVVLPWVPAIATQRLSRMSSASISARRTTGRRRARAAVSSGLSRLIAVDTTTTSASPSAPAEWPMEILAPLSRRRLTLALSEASDPWTVYPRLMSTSAMPLMPMPPMPTKWIGPISLGSFMLSFPVYIPGSARRDATSCRCCHAQHQLGQPLGGVGAALRAGGRGHCYELLRRAGKRGDFGCQPIGREIVLAQAHRPARLLQHAGIGGLILIERVGQRHQDGRPPDGSEFCHGRSARARDHDVARRDPRRQIGEERRDLGRDLRSRVDVGNPGEVLLTRLLHDGEARLQITRQSLDCDRHVVGHDARALAAAEY